MFKVQQTTDNGFEVWQLKEDEGTVVTIVLTGAMLKGFSVKQGENVFECIDTYPNVEIFNNSKEEHGFNGLKLSPYPCRIPDAKYRIKDKWYTFDSYLKGGDSIHGLLYNKPFKVMHQYADDTKATLLLEYTYTALDKGFPFLYSCTVKYTLTENHSLTVDTIIQNLDEQVIPIADGWHPYFTLGGKVDDWILHFDAPYMLEFQNYIPTGKKVLTNFFNKPEQIGAASLDNSFVVDFSASGPKCVLHNPQNGLTLHITPEESYPYLQIYIPPHRKSIAIENLSAPPNAFNNGIGLIMLEPSDAVRFSTNYSLLVNS